MYVKTPIPEKLRQFILQRDGKCRYCKSTENLCVDHVYPESLGGEATKENLVTSCKSCNSSKGSKELKNWERGKESLGEWLRAIEANTLRFEERMAERRRSKA